MENNLIYILVVSAIFYGITMKIADLLDEHGLKWFKGSKIIFGFLWGFFGSVLVLGDVIVANMVLAMNIAFIVRGRLDYLNHQIASSIIIIIFLLYSSISPVVFIIFYLIFIIFGSLKDYVDDVLKKKNIIAIINESMLYYPIPTFIYCVIYGNWIIFLIFLLYTVGYDLTKYLAKQKGYR